MTAVRHRLHGVVDEGAVLRALFACRAFAGKFRNVRTRCEGFVTGAAQDHTTQRLVGRQLPHGVRQPFPHGAVEGVQFAGVGERYGGDCAVAFGQDAGGHGALSRVVRLPL